MFKMWTPRDLRQLMALMFLAGAGLAMTLFAWRTLALTAERSTGPWPIAYALYGVLALIAIVITGFATVLGRRMFKGAVGNANLELSGGVDDNGEPLPAPVTTVTTTTAVATPVASSATTATSVDEASVA
jgi:hypothetical protein